MLGSLIDSVDTMLDSFGSALKHSLGDYCDLETADDKHVLVAKNGALLTIVRVEGMRKLVGNSTLFEQVILPIQSSIQSNFENKAHQVQVWFEVDHDRTQEEVRKVLAPARAAAKSLQMDLTDVFDERERVLCGMAAAERCFLVLWTLPSALSKSENKSSKAISKKEGANRVGTRTAQDPMRANVMLRNRHVSFVENFCRELEGSYIVTSKLRVKEALREVRRSIDPGFTGPDWEPALPGDMLLPTQRMQHTSRDEWETLWPRLGWQLCPRDAKVVDENAVEIGDRVYAPLYIDLFPKDIEFFRSLFYKARAAEEDHMPWRISFLMEGGGMEGFRMKGLMAQLLGFTSPGNNKPMSQALKEMEARKNQGQTIVQARVALATWAPRGQMDKLALRRSYLARCVESWGGCSVSEVTGDPTQGVASTGLGFTKGSIATKAAAPMEDFLAMMPWDRPSSPFPTGAVTWVSPDGKLMPFEPYSSLQVSWIYLICARPGSGKSVLMNMMHLALSVKAGLQQLPRIAIIDIGPSSSGLISLLRESLPPSMRHLVTHRRLRMVAEGNSINPFDTQLGCRFPTALEMAFLTSFVSLMITEVDTGEIPKGMAGMVPLVIKEMYRAKSDKSADANRYDPGLVPKVDEAVGRLGMKVERGTLWWEVVDFLFLHKEYYLAKVAQRYAVPLLADAVGAAMDERIRNTYDFEIAGTGEELIKAFSRMIAEALNYIPLLGSPTSFDVGEANIVALDLDEVAKQGGKLADHISAAMYMLARQVLAKDYYINEDSVSEMPAPAEMDLLNDTVPVRELKMYHVERIRGLKELPKRICYDEFHRTKTSQAVRAQVVRDMREGRKYQVDVILASQDIEDFDDEMIKFSSGLFVMDKGNNLVIDSIANKFGFTDAAEKNALEKQVRPPRQGMPGTFMAKLITSAGDYTMLLRAPLGPIELWAFSTTAEDVAVRSRCYDQLSNPRLARQALARLYPRGSAKSDIEDRRQRLKDTIGMLDDTSDGNIIEEVVAEVLAAAQDIRRENEGRVR